jgi:hypothetical protein
VLSLVAGLATADTDAAKVFHGAIYVESYDQVMVIAVDSDANGARDGKADTVFVVATPESFVTPVSYRWTNASLVFKASGVMVTSPADREALVVTFKRDVPHANFTTPAEFHTTRVANAIGLAHHSALADEYFMDAMPPGNGRGHGRHGSEWVDEGWTRQPFQNNWDYNSGGGGCMSGGSGSLSCSIGGCASTQGRNDCSVSCIGTGYYACCNCGSCTCLRYDGRN